MNDFDSSQDSLIQFPTKKLEADLDCCSQKLTKSEDEYPAYDVSFVEPLRPPSFERTNYEHKSNI